MSERWQRRLAWANLIIGIAAAASVALAVYWMRTGDMDPDPIRVLDMVLRIGLAIVLLLEAAIFFRSPGADS